jgi:hypothetical protein
VRPAKLAAAAAPKPSSDVRAAGAIAVPGESKSSNLLLLVDLVFVGLGLLLVAGALAPAGVLPIRWGPTLDRHRLDFVFLGLAIAVSLALAAVLSSVLSR